MKAADTPIAEKKRMHRCMRCLEEFECENPSQCAVKYDALSTIRVGDKHVDHCPPQPDWNWIRAYAERRIARAEERVRVLERESACPCCKAGVNIEGDPCSECKASGFMSVAYETARIHEKLAQEQTKTLEERVRVLTEALETVQSELAGRSWEDYGFYRGKRIVLSKRQCARINAALSTSAPEQPAQPSAEKEGA